VGDVLIRYQSHTKIYCVVGGHKERERALAGDHWASLMCQSVIISRLVVVEMCHFYTEFSTSWFMIVMFAANQMVQEDLSIELQMKEVGFEGSYFARCAYHVPSMPSKNMRCKA
jgi:hypothetical protein